MPRFSFIAMAREPTGAPIHLRPHADVAERVLAPGDPGRALRLAQVLLDQPLMLNHNRGLWGYTGAAADGAPLTIQSTGLGGPSAAIVTHELIALGARRIVRVGTCGALGGALALGALVAADPVLARDGTSRALGASERLAPDPALLDVLRDRATATGPVASTDLFYAAPGHRARAGALAYELEAAAVLAVCAAAGVAAACVLLVVADAAGGRLDVDAVHTGELQLGRAGAAAFGL